MLMFLYKSYGTPKFANLILSPFMVVGNHRYNAAKEAYNSLKNKDQLLTRWRFAKILHAVFEQPQELPSVFDDFSSVVPDEEDKGPDSEYLACATELRIHVSHKPC